MWVVAHVACGHGFGREVGELRVPEPYRGWAIAFLALKTPLADPERRPKVSKNEATVSHETIGEFVRVTVAVAGLKEQVLMIPQGYHLSVTRDKTSPRQEMDCLPEISQWQAVIWRWFKQYETEHGRPASISECVVGLDSTETLTRAATRRLTRMGLLKSDQRDTHTHERIYSVVETPFTVRPAAKGPDAVCGDGD
jgi:hypothetical protein